MERFADRLDANRYDSGEPVVVGLASRSSRPPISVPEGVFARLQALGRAYDLHILRDVVTPYAETSLAPEQADAILAELEFLAEIVDDPLVVGAATTLRVVFAEAARTNTIAIIDWAL